MTSPTSQPDELADVLHDSASQLRKAFPDLERTPPDVRGLALMRALREMEGLEARIGEIIALDPSLGSLSNGWVSFGGMASPPQPHALSSALLEGVLFSGEPADEVLRRFRTFAEKRTSGGEWYGAIAGATIAKACELVSGVDLIPWIEVPDCPQRARLSREIFSPGSLIGPRAKPNCALRFKLPERPALSLTATDASILTSQSTELSDMHLRAQDVLRAMTAATGRPIAILGSWPHASEPVLQQILGTTLHVSDSLSDIAMFGPSVEPAVLDGQLVARIFACLEKFRGTGADALRTALDRFSYSRRQTTTVNKAIDLGIALEVILLHEISDPERGELKYRSAVRGAHFLGGDRSERLANFKCLKNAYDLRSKAVHMGQLPGDAKETETLESGAKLCALIARKIVEMGRFPKWEEEYVFSTDG